MVRGGKAQSKRNSKRRVNNNEDSDESDEDYVASDAQSDASEDVLVDLAEDSLDDEVDEPVVDDNDDDDDDFKVIEDEEEEEEDDDSDFVKSGRSGSKTVRKPNVVSLRKEEEEEEDDFKVIEDEEEEEEDDDSDFVKSGRSVSKTVRKPNVVSLRKEDDEDYEANLDDEDEDEDDEEFTPEEDDSLEEEEEICVSKKRLRSKIDLQPKVKEWGSRKRRKLTTPKKSSRNRRGRIVKARKKPRLDDEFEDEDDIGVRKTVKSVKRKKKTISRRKRSCSSKSGIDLVSSESSDFEFTISEEEREQIREASKFCGDLAVPQRSLALAEKPKQERPSRSRVATSQCTAGPPMNTVVKGKQKVEEVDPKQVCGICFSEEDKRRVRGKLDCCTHYFCFTCIMEWAKVETRCPLCKQRFKTINKPSRATTGVDLRDVVIQVPERDQVYQPTEEEIRGYLDPYENVICTECHLGGDDGLMLLCDLCDSPAHTFCVGLGREVPEGNWYCEGCRPAAIGSGIQDGPTGRAQAGSNAIDGLDLNVVPAPVPSFNQRVVGNLAFPRFPGEINPLMYPLSGSGSPTLTGRRMLQSHIQRLRSGSRLNPLVRRPDGATPPATTRVDSFIGLRLLQQNGSLPVRNQDGFSDGSGLAPPPSVSGGFGFGVGPTHEPLRLLQSSSNGARQDISFYTAMEQMQSVVQNHLSRLSVDLRLGQDQMKDIVRSATQSILAACGPGRTETDRAPQPLFCPHSDRRTIGDTSPIRDLCSGCFHEFTRNVVQSIVNSKLPQNQNEWLSLGL